ncbi:hypothetical protein BGX24_006336 [Mortierella sp. AD032]|nr:hypothetical protein BGX24_006336 [Mortierella sp. AD032]
MVTPPTAQRRLYASSGRDIVLWDDILAVFKSALYVRSGAVALPFLKGLDFKNLDPLRIVAVPGASLDLVVRGQPNDKELSVENLQDSLPDAPHENRATSPRPQRPTPQPQLATALQPPL